MTLIFRILFYWMFSRNETQKKQVLLTKSTSRRRKKGPSSTDGLRWTFVKQGHNPTISRQSAIRSGSRCIVHCASPRQGLRRSGTEMRTPSKTFCANHWLPLGEMNVLRYELDNKMLQSPRPESFHIVQWRKTTGSVYNNWDVASLIFLLRSFPIWITYAKKLRNIRDLDVN